MHARKFGFTLSMLLVSALWCSAPQSLEFTVPPALTLDPTGRTPLAGLVEFETDVPSSVGLAIRGGAEPRYISFPELSTSHAVPVLGLKPDSVYEVDVSATDAVGNTVVATPALQVTTGALPADFPVVQLLKSDPVRMEPGYTLLDKFMREAGAPEPAYAMIVDRKGNVVWYSTLGGLQGTAIVQLANGDLRYRDGTALVQTDMLGNEIERLPLEASNLTHDLMVTEEGTILSITRTPVVVDNYPTNYDDPDPRQTVEIRDEPIIEFEADGTFRNLWPLVDLIDTTRIGYNSLNETPLGLDWVHNNAVFHDPRDNSILVSARHQDAVVKFSRVTGELIWILGSHDNWTEGFWPYLLEPVGVPFEWQYHQHAPEVTPAGTILLFDNGNRRTSPFDGKTPVPDSENASRAVEYAIDEANMTVSQVWEYVGTGANRVYSEAQGDADWLPLTGNVLVDFSGTSYTNGEFNCLLGVGRHYTRVVEVTHTQPPVEVFDLAVYNPVEPAPDCTPRIYTYRTDRIPSLYGSSASVVQAPELTTVPDRTFISRGQTISYVLTATNKTGVTQCADVWTGVVPPESAPGPGDELPLLGPHRGCLDPFTSRTQTLSHTVPADAPLGRYSHNAYVGIHPLILRKSSFDVEVIP